MTIADFPQFAAALAILLSVVIRSLRNDSSWIAVDEGRVTAQTLRDLTGILEFDQLQETFGAPRMDDGVFPVTRRKILREHGGDILVQSQLGVGSKFALKLPVQSPFGADPNATMNETPLLRPEPE